MEEHSSFDLVVMRHAGAVLADCDLLALFKHLRGLAPVVVMVETDITDRSHYRLLDSVRDEYESINKAAFALLLSHHLRAMPCGGGAAACRPFLRTDDQIRAILRGASAEPSSTFYFQGSAFNTVAFVLIKK
jgi:hypothetical protein